MIIVDTSILIEMFRRYSTHPAHSMDPRCLGVCALVRVELLTSARDEADFARIDGALRTYGALELPPDFWQKFEQFAFQIKRRGVTVSFVDAALATLSIQLRKPVWSLDKDFAHINRFFPEVELHEAISS